MKYRVFSYEDSQSVGGAASNDFSITIAESVIGRGGEQVCPPGDIAVVIKKSGMERLPGKYYDVSRVTGIAIGVVGKEVDDQPWTNKEYPHVYNFGLAGLVDDPKTINNVLSKLPNRKCLSNRMDLGKQDELELLVRLLAEHI